MMAFANHGMAFTEKSWLISLLGTCSMVKRKGLFGYSILLFKGLGDQGSWVARFDRGEIVRSQFVDGSHLHRKISMTGPGCTVISNLTPKELDLYIYIYIEIKYAISFTVGWSQYVVACFARRHVLGIEVVV